MGLVVVVPLGGLMKNFSHLEIDLEAKEPRGVCKGGRDTLMSLFCVGEWASVVHQEEILDQSLLCLDVGLEAL